jgi:hypothetical protein
MTTPPTTLHERIAAELARRTAVANAATPGPWTTSGPDTIAEWSIYALERGWMVATAEVNDYPDSAFPKLRGGITGDEANRNAAHIALHDPADALRRYAGELQGLERHAIVLRDIGWLEDRDTRYEKLPVCARCVPKYSQFRTRADVPVGACDETKGVASRLGVSVDG